MPEESFIPNRVHTLRWDYQAKMVEQILVLSINMVVRVIGFLQVLYHVLGEEGLLVHNVHEGGCRPRCSP